MIHAKISSQQLLEQLKQDSLQLTADINAYKQQIKQQLVSPVGLLSAAVVGFALSHTLLPQTKTEVALDDPALALKSRALPIILEVVSGFALSQLPKLITRWLRQ